MKYVYIINDGFDKLYIFSTKEKALRWANELIRGKKGERSGMECIKSFTTLAELLGIDDKGTYKTTAKGKYKKGEKKGGRLKGKTVAWKFGGTRPLSYEQIPSYVLAQVKQSQPVQVQNLLAWIAGEMEAFDAIANSMGLGVRSTYEDEDEEAIETADKARKEGKRFIYVS